VDEDDTPETNAELTFFFGEERDDVWALRRLDILG
jgi:hypothetical protein